MNSPLLRALILAAVTVVTVSIGADAAVTTYDQPNYTFPDGAAGFKLDTSGGPINPGVLVGFNPQPDPPGAPPALLDLADKASPKIFDSTGLTFYLELAFTGLPGVDGLLLPAVQKPNAGVTDFQIVLADGSVLKATLDFSGPGGVFSWIAVNPQPLPPGGFIAYKVGFAGDASFSLQLAENGSALNFALAPEPSTWALMGLGFAALGAIGYRRAARSAALISRA
ncbi:MAG: PEP-CTERM sorting domain-containing protein [Hyphomicrobiales bacterium]|nr:PEP-CTERM sorting domain-containing protein [Hyphomicrobiales bacterium]MBV8439936.1 PEP-CTERM sorting domain-containing protein [Hyphomicrobiales bacterium]